jgi:hypothetical protein
LFLAAFLNAKTTLSGAKVHTQVFSVLFNDEFAQLQFALDAGTGVERHARCAVIPQDVTSREHEYALAFPGRPGPPVSTPRGHLRPDKMGRERPPSERVRGRPPGVAEGVAHAPSSHSTIIRAASVAAQSAATFR